MRILFLPPNGKLYGSNKSLLSVMVYLNKEYDILLFSPFTCGFTDELEKNNVNHKILPYYASLLYVRINNPKYLIYPFLILLDLIMFPFLLYEAARFNPDVIYSNSSVENMGILIAKILKKKHITHVREFGDLDYDFHFVAGRKNKRKYLNLSDGIIFNSKIVEAEVLPGYLQKAKTRIIYNGLKENNIEYVNLNFPQKEPFTFGLVGHLQSKKGQLEGLSFLAKHLKSNNIKLKIFGDGVPAYLLKIKNFINNNHLSDRVKLMGFTKNGSEIYKSIDVLLVFAKNEAFGRVTIEAMQAGIPVIAFNGGGTKELIDEKVDGLLFTNEEEFDSSIQSILNDFTLYETISRNAMNKVRLNFSEDTYCKNVEDFIKEVTSI